MKELDEIDQLFQTTFEGFESIPDPQVKIAIDRAIASKKKRRRFLFILFPVLFGTTALGAILLYTPDSKEVQRNQNVQNVQRDQISSDQSRLITTGQKDQKVQKRHQQKIQKYPTDSKIQSGSDQSRLITIVQKDQVNTENQKPETPAYFLAETDSTLERSEANAAENTPDSLTATTPGDSSAVTNLAATIDESGPLPEVTKSHTKWSISAITGWENESKRAAQHFDSLDLSLASSESARIQSTSFYAKIEINRRINARLDVLTGIGFHSSRITQHGSLYTLDSSLVVESVSSSPPGAYAYFIRKQNESRSYQIHSLILPLGIAYSAPLGESFRFRISGGAQLAYSWLSEKQSGSPLTKPEFRSFGLNAWLRPEIHYNFGNFQVFGFGSFNQPLVRQLNWNFDVKRNPAFGAGIGLLIRL